MFWGFCCESSTPPWDVLPRQHSIKSNLTHSFLSRTLFIFLLENIFFCVKKIARKNEERSDSWSSLYCVMINWISGRVEYLSAPFSPPHAIIMIIISIINPLDNDKLNFKVPPSSYTTSMRECANNFQHIHKKCFYVKKLWAMERGIEAWLNVHHNFQSHERGTKKHSVLIINLQLN